MFLSFLSRSVRIGLLLVVMLLGGCIGYRVTLEQVDSLSRSGQYQQAVAALDKSGLANGKKDRLLYLMERGLLLNLAGDYQQSHRALQEADDLTEELVTRSVSRETLSFVLNDSTVAYRGEDYESAYLNYYKALNFVALGDYEAAAVEARRVDEKLTWYFDLYQGKNSYREDAFLRLLTGLLYEAYGDFDNALVAYRRSLAAYRQQRDLYRVALPELLWQRLLPLSKRFGTAEEYSGYLQQAPATLSQPAEGDALLVVLIDRGQIPPKQEAGVLLPTTRGQPIKIAVPVLAREIRAQGQVNVRLDGVRAGQVETVGNLDAIARRSLEDKQARILAKEAARAIAKESLVRHSESQLGSTAGAIARIVSILTTNADLRSWRLLPSRIEMALLPLAAGAHQVEIVLGNRSVVNRIDTGRGQVQFLYQRLFD